MILKGPLIIFKNQYTVDRSTDIFVEHFRIDVANTNTFVLYNGENLDHYSEMTFFKWNFYKFRAGKNLILPGIQSLIAKAFL